MHLKFAHLADYAAPDSRGKLTIVGSFDIVFDAMKTRPIPFPPCYLVASFAASLSEGTDHEFEIRFVDADEHAVRESFRGSMHLRPFGPGYPLRANVVLGFGPEALTVPELGDYRFVFLVDGAPIGDLAVSVIEPPPAS
jgi:uncharacterized protein DUF6941